LKKLDNIGNFDQAVDYLAQVGSMHKRDQDVFSRRSLTGGSKHHIVTLYNWETIDSRDTLFMYAARRS
jgi:hypothetical protein